jgi:uncharacterized OB-fold protein
MTRERIQESPATVFHRELSEGRLMYQRCGGCGAAVFYPRLVCPSCASTDLRWAPSSGAGVLYSATTVRSRSGDYSVALVDLDEGFRMMSRVDAGGGTVAIGDRVRARLARDMTLEALGFEKEG